MKVQELSQTIKRTAELASLSGKLFLQKQEKHELERMLILLV